MILPLGIAAFLVFYVVFRFAIVKFDLKTPGREDDDDLEAEKSAVLANNNYTEVASVILERTWRQGKCENLWKTASQD